MKSSRFDAVRVVEKSSAGVRLDSFLLTFPFSKIIPDFNPSRSYLQGWIRDGFVSVNGLTCTDKSYRCRAGDRIEITALIDLQENLPPPESMNIRIVFRDEHLLVIDKPPGISSHPVPKNLTGTVVNFLIHEGISLPVTSHPLRPGIVHRLDKNTSGLMVIARTDNAMASLTEMIRLRTVQRNYLAIVFGSPPLDSGTIDAGILRHQRDRKKMAVSRSESARHAVTHFNVIQRFPGFSLLGCKLETGRTHQIRVHLSHIGYPVAGDPLYGGRRAMDRVENALRSMKKNDPAWQKLENRLARVAEIITSDQVHLLHAAKLEFVHPVTCEKMVFTAKPHEKFRSVLSILESINGKVSGHEI